MRKAWRIVRLALGGVCIGLGVVGLFLPFLQGILLLVVGLSLLSADSERARQYRDRLQDWLARRTLLRRKRESADG